LTSGKCIKHRERVGIAKVFWRESGVNGGNAFAHGKFDQHRFCDLCLTGIYGENYVVYTAKKGDLSKTDSLWGSDHTYWIEA
jgi:hypothetical protein